MQNKKYKLRPSVSVTYSNGVIMFFLTDIRKSIKYKISSEEIVKIILSLDGTKSIEDIGKEKHYSIEEMNSLSMFFEVLEKKSILVAYVNYDFVKDYSIFRRVIHYLENYASSKEKLMEMWNNIRAAHVIIFGIGGVGTWVAHELVSTGIRNITLVDFDKVEMSNLNRQFGFSEKDIGMYKIDALKNTLNRKFLNLNISLLYEKLDEHFFSRYKPQCDLIVNCTDKPSVDFTSRLIDEYSKSSRIPIIIGGGYNRHLTLIGQSIIPGKTPCFDCSTKEYSNKTIFGFDQIKKLKTRGRKLGTVAPLSVISSTLICFEAIKILTKVIPPVNTNRRGEFDFVEKKIKYHIIEKKETCNCS